MTRFLIGAVLALLLAAPGVAQQPPQPPQPDYPMAAVLAARASLIQRYVQSLKVARGVAVCGETDLLTGEDHTFLTVYVWQDTVSIFVKDYLNFATPTPGDGLHSTFPIADLGGNLGVNGIPVVVVLVGSAPKIEKEPNPNVRPNRSTSPKA
jgi:hypothetical protein